MLLRNIIKQSKPQTVAEKGAEEKQKKIICSRHPQHISQTVGSCKATKYRVREGRNVSTGWWLPWHALQLVIGPYMKMMLWTWTRVTGNYADKLLDLHLAKDWSLEWHEIWRSFNGRVEHFAALAGAKSWSQFARYVARVPSYIWIKRVLAWAPLGPRNSGRFFNSWDHK